MKELIRKEIQNSIDVKMEVLNNTNIISQLETLVNDCISSLQNGGKIIFCGNGGSFADSQHLAAEFVSRLSFKVSISMFSNCGLQCFFLFKCFLKSFF